MNNPLDGGEPDSRSRKLINPVKPLKRAEEPADIGHVKSHTVVPDKNNRFAVLHFRAELNAGMLVFTGELAGIIDQVGQGDVHQALIRMDDDSLLNVEGDVALRVLLPAGIGDFPDHGAQIAILWHAEPRADHA